MRVEIPSNADLAARARELADAAPRGSMARKSAGCAAIALGDSNTLATAKRILNLLWQEDIKAAALQVIDQLVQDHLAAPGGGANEDQDGAPA